ncbi:hypothetical protein [Faecalibacter sp. LW9]|uniref:hypothetical protein n=1 Tax=Faecalibacter sp. LW9 TaxID=3103144 RepID=UPI002AFFAA33|nr:hypothetical protein [Faecalibacter sp. LW9]
MKKYIITSILLFAGTLVSAQVAIGKETINGTSTILDFYDAADNFRGIILPAVNDTSAALAANTIANNGTFLFDRTDKKVKMYENGAWVELSEEGDYANLIVNTSDENNQEQGVIIGSETSEAKGVLVLESADKAVILPKIANPHATVNSPYPGMMCYDTASKSLAVFDGSVWNYWK